MGSQSSGSTTATDALPDARRRGPRRVDAGVVAESSPRASGFRLQEDILGQGRFHHGKRAHGGAGRRKAVSSRKPWRASWITGRQVAMSSKSTMASRSRGRRERKTSIQTELSTCTRLPAGLRRGSSAVRSNSDRYHLVEFALTRTGPLPGQLVYTGRAHGFVAALPDVGRRSCATPGPGA